MSLLKQLKAYAPYNEQETNDKEVMIKRELRVLQMVKKQMEN